MGFEKALGLFIIGMYGFVCLTWMAIRDTCGAVIYNWLCQTVIERYNYGQEEPKNEMSHLVE